MKIRIAFTVEMSKKQLHDLGMRWCGEPMNREQFRDWMEAMALADLQAAESEFYEVRKNEGAR